LNPNPFFLADLLLFILSHFIKSICFRASKRKLCCVGYR
jgi:hypothetical protein